VIYLGSFEEKACRFVLSLILLIAIASVLPELRNFIGIEAILGYGLGVVYVRDRYGRYHYTWDGRYISRDEACCLQLFAILFGIGIPAAITIWGLPYYALHELLTATFGSEFIAIFGGFGLFE
jgi:hypothetical protein